MDQEFIVDKSVKHIKISTDQPNERYILQCKNCHKKLEFGFNFTKYNNLKEACAPFIFEHKLCK